MLYFTSGTTARPKLVEHTHTSYPIGHLATMYWIGLRPGDVHLNISSPGWAKHAWSNLFAPWNAEATVFLHNYTRFDAPRLMAEMDKAGVTTFCAPPTVWRMLIQADLSLLRTRPARSSPPVNRSTPRSSSRSGGPGASPSGTASARPRPPSRCPTAPPRSSRPAPWAAPAPATASNSSTPSPGRPARPRARSPSTSPTARWA
ncbi:hypothetical protein SHKM778_30740 [Streptomyces sp. KM77-8]|uniref:AMP-dependent synthetase/ligase domain-containing protein n=1 Tax=Streptomyces haneummycinicus TaxID=3074435 RepID=A0AAT9HGZ4_9ACTN